MNRIQTIFQELSSPAQDLFRCIQTSEFKLIQIVNNQAIIPNTQHELSRARTEMLIRELTPIFLKKTAEKQWQIPEPLRDAFI